MRNCALLCRTLSRSPAEISTHHLGDEGEVCSSAVRQKGTVVVRRPRAPVHPQHGADSRGGRRRVYRLPGASVTGRGRSFTSVDLVRGTEELGIPQLRERHVRRARKANLSEVRAVQEKKRQECLKKKKKSRKSKNPQKKLKTIRGGCLDHPLPKCQASPPPRIRRCLTNARWHLE